MRNLVPIALVAAAATLAPACSTHAPAPHAIAIAPAPEPVAPPYRWTQGNAPKAHKDMVAAFGKLGLKPGEYVWSEAVPKSGDNLVIVDLLTQTAYAYRGETLVGASSISSAKQGMVTPLGFWSVLEKKKMHRSRKYDNAPMPFMQRIDEYGIALHGGANPGYPASHGCVRMPMKFAEKLYALTGIGTKVVIEG